MPTSSSKAPKRKSRGRQKMEMVKMENKNNLQVTFSKRRAGLFKKASELCTLCGAEAIIVVFSPTEKPYSFAHPNMETMVNRYLGGNSPAPHSTIGQVIIDAHRESTIRNLNLELTQVESMLALEKRRGEEIDLMRKICEIEKWFPTDENEGDHGLDFEQVCVLKNTVLNFKKILEDGAQKSMDGLSNLAEPPMGNNNENVLGDFSFDVGGPSTNNIPTYGTTPLSVGGFVNGFYPINNAAGTTGFTNNSTDFYTPAMVEYNPLN